MAGNRQLSTSVATPAVDAMPHPTFDRPIVILGAPRSGTTLLARVLGSARSCVLANEPRLVWRYGNDSRSDQLRAEDASPRVISHVRSSLDDLVRGAGATRLVEKTPANSLRPDFVAAVLPEARFIHITRNGWAAAPSFRSMWGRRATSMDSRKRARTRARVKEASPAQMPYYVAEFAGRLAGRVTGRVALVGPRTPGLRHSVDELGVLAAAAIQWRECTTQSTAFGRGLEPDRYLEVKLESLSVEVMEEILRFCEIDDETVIEHFSEIHDGRLAARQPELTPHEVDLLTPYVAPTNGWLGYPWSYDDSGPLS